MSMWTKELDSRLVEAKAQGLSFAQVAGKIGVSRNAALGRYARINGATFPCFERRRQTALSATRKKREEFKARQDAALKAFERDISSGVPRNQAVVAAISLGCGRAAMAVRLGVTVERVRQIVARYGCE
ncbi:MAG: hypothetical protein JWL86_2813 [Rhizobium sp.]|nr:hypothetical protein [Rhizobium sp.]